MASALYTSNFLTIQGLAPSERISVYCVNLAEPTTFVVRNVSYYCGNPSPLAPSSVVLIPGHADNGFPTAWSANDGERGVADFNPFFGQDDVNIVTKTFQPLTGQQLIFYVVNTSQDVGTFDLTISGWCLPGLPSATYEFSIP